MTNYQRMKRHKYQISEVAIAELSLIQDLLWEARPGHDRLFTQKLEDIIDRLCVLPESGEPRPELGEGLRAVPLWRYMIFYRLAGDLVIIEHVIHGARDIVAAFSAFSRPPK
jgi:toxin ParE1/3/4